MPNTIYHQIGIPRILIQDNNTRVNRTGNNLPLSSGIGRALAGVRAVVTSVDATLPNPALDPSQNRTGGVVFHVGAVPCASEGVG